MNGNRTAEQFKNDLCALGVREGDTVMMHASFKALGGIEGGAQAVIDGLLAVLGEEGTLILPAFSYDTVTAENPVFDAEQTPSCAGYLPEYFRTQVDGVIRSLHATHSCCIKGKRAAELASGHERDLTPVGEQSPIAKLPRMGGKILILGSHPDHNTALHGVEELVEPPYLFETQRVPYVLKSGETVIRQQAIRHSFHEEGCYYAQRYARVIDLLDKTEYAFGKVLDADCYLFCAQAVWQKAKEQLLRDPLFFVDKVSV